MANDYALTAGSVGPLGQHRKLSCHAVTSYWHGVRSSSLSALNKIALYPEIMKTQL